MAKFLKSIFHPTETRKSAHRDVETEEDKNEEPQLNGRRKLSMSRSGRLKQANKKRHSLTMGLYGEDNIQPFQRPKTMEYHVHSPANQSPQPIDKNQRRRSTDDDHKTDNVKISHTVAESPKTDRSALDNSVSDGGKSPEEEIDSAFEIIDKS